MLPINYFRLFLNTLKIKASLADSYYSSDDQQANFNIFSAIKYLLMGILFGFILAYIESIIKSKAVIFSAMLNSIFTPLIWILVGLLIFVFYTSICLKNHIMKNIGEWFGLQLEVALKTYGPAKCIYLFIFFSAIFDSYLISLFVLESAPSSSKRYSFLITWLAGSQIINHFIIKTYGNNNK